MKIPDTFIELLEDRIKFTGNFIAANAEITNINSYTITEFILAYENFKYCKKLYQELLQDKKNEDLEKLFGAIACKLLFEIIHSLNTQEYKCININGQVFPTKEKEVLPQEISDNIQKMKVAITKIYNEVTNLCRN